MLGSPPGEFLQSWKAIESFLEKSEANCKTFVDNSGLDFLLQHMKTCGDQMEELSCFVNIVSHLTLLPDIFNVLRSHEVVNGLWNVTTSRSESKAVSGTVIFFALDIFWIYCWISEN